MSGDKGKGETAELRRVRAFEGAFSAIGRTIEFDPCWHDGKGSFKNATDVEIPIGARAKSVDEVGRQLIFIGTRFGTLVVYKRHSVYVLPTYMVCWPHMFPNSMKFLLTKGGPLCGEEIERLCGDDAINYNIGFTLEKMARDLGGAIQPGVTFNEDPWAIGIPSQPTLGETHAANC